MQMANVAKLFLLLEELRFTGNDVPKQNASETQQEDERLKWNLQTLRKYIRERPDELVTTTAVAVEAIQPLGVLSMPEEPNVLYSVYLQHVLLLIANGTNFESDAKEDLISVRHMNLYIAAVQDLAVIALRQQLHKQLLLAGSVFATPAASGNASTPNYSRLQLTVGCFARLLPIKQLHVAQAMEAVVRDYMAAIVSLQLAVLQQEITMTEPESCRMMQHFQIVWLHVSKLQYFRNILLLKATPQLPPQMQQKLHAELLRKLQAQDGFATLVATLQATTSRNGTNQDDKRVCEALARIVAHRAHSAAHQRSMLAQVFNFLPLCLQNAAMLPSLSAALLCLRRLYDLSGANRLDVRRRLHALLQPLTTPVDILSGLIVMEHVEYCRLVALLHELFCTSSVECLPSAELVFCLPLLHQLYQHTPSAFKQQQRQLAALVTRCLDNRPAAELAVILEQLFSGKYAPDWLTLHPRLLLAPGNAAHTELRLVLGGENVQPRFSPSQTLPALLLITEHHELSYRVLMALLRLWQRQGSEQPGADLIGTDSELVDFLNARYPLKVELLLALNTLVSQPSLKTQLAAHAKEFLHFLREVIEQQAASTCDSSSAADLLLLLLTLAQEVLESMPFPTEHSSAFAPALRRLQQQPSLNPLLQQRLASLHAVLNDEAGPTLDSDHATSPYHTARALIESPEPHLQVYGMQLLLSMLRQRDPAVLANTHVIVALALRTLRSPESYTFLNCVRLFVALARDLRAEEAPVLELLVDEFLSETAALDYRLVVGEALLKVSQELGPLIYNHKALLLNCFMSGARSPHDEFRMSAYANLAQLCRTLCYQVHSFFEELLQLIDCELSATPAYLPAQRAAVLVLSELLEGIEQLADFGDMLLPVYRLLKQLEAAPPQHDERLRTHAANGLKALNVKCFKLFQQCAEAPLHKTIKVRGIKEQANAATSASKRSGGLKSMILEMN